jgi:sugar lactone lactonase YvrE
MSLFPVLGRLAAIALALAGAEARAQTANTILESPLSTPEGIAFDKSGNLIVANNAGNSIDIVAPDGSVNLLAARFVGGVETDNIVAPDGVALDAAGNIYVANTGNNSVVRIAPDGMITNIAGGGNGLTTPLGLAVDSAGNLFVTNAGAHTVSEITPAGVVSTFVATGLTRPTALAIDAADNLYVADDGAGTIDKVTPAGALTILASGPFTDNGGIAVDASGDLLVTDNANSVIRKISQAGVVTTVASGFAAWGVAVDGTGDIFFASRQGNTINEVTPAGVVSQFVQAPINGPQGIVSDRQGNLFFTNSPTNGSSNAVQKIDANGTITRFATGLDQPTTLAIDSNGNLYVENSGNGTISKIAPDATISLFATGLGGPMAVDADGNLFAAPPQLVASQIPIMEVTQSGAVSTFATVTGMIPTGLAFDPAGNLYLAIGSIDTGDTNSLIYKITPAAVVSTFVTGTDFPSFLDVGFPITFDAAGNLLVAADVDSLHGNVLKIAPDGTVGTVLTTGEFDTVSGLTIDEAGNLYATASDRNAIVQIALAPSPLAAATLPDSRSVQVGTAAGVYATMLNTGGTDLAGCAPRLPGMVSNALTLDYQTTDPATNLVVGTFDQPVTIPAHGSQSFVLGFDSPLPLTAPGQPVLFGCAGASPAPIVTGLDTVDLLFSATPVPDIIAESVTASGNGIVTVPVGKDAAFAAATFDNGTAGTLAASVDTGAATLPVTVTVCQTNPQTGQCLATAASSIQVAFTANATPTFSVFVTASAAIPLDPANSRIFLRFEDVAGGIHGSTSVAVQAM